MTNYMNCEHMNFMSKANIFRLESGKFMAEIQIECSDCHRPFEFLGLPAGLNLEGAAVEFGGREARLAIKPANEEYDRIYKKDES